jgi:hypothetical protein
MFTYFIIFAVGFIIGFVATYLEYKAIGKTIDVVDARFTHAFNYLESLIRKVEGIKNQEVKNIEAGAKTDVADAQKDVSQEASKVVNITDKTESK